MKLIVNNLDCGYGKTKILKSINFSVKDGEFACLLGPNGVGKTTLFKTILGLLKPINGDVRYNEKSILGMNIRQRSRLMAYVPQSTCIQFPFSVLDVVVMGRSPWINAFANPDKNDYQIAESVLHSLSIEYLSHKLFSHISGGERQLVLIARALCQQPRLLILDEPTASLDFGNQVAVLAEIKKLTGRGIGVIMTTHHPDHAFRIGSKVILIGENSIVKKGPPQKVITEKNIRDYFSVNAEIMQHSLETGEKVMCCLPLFERSLL